MKAGLEKNLKENALKWLRTIPESKWLKRHGNAYTEAGNPDIEGCIKGIHVEIELKKPGEKPDGLQLVRIEEWKKAGAVAFWTDNLADLRKKMFFELVAKGIFLRTETGERHTTESWNKRNQT